MYLLDESNNLDAITAGDNILTSWINLVQYFILAYTMFFFIYVCDQAPYP